MNGSDHACPACGYIHPDLNDNTTETDDTQPPQFDSGRRYLDDGPMPC